MKQNTVTSATLADVDEIAALLAPVFAEKAPIQAFFPADKAAELARYVQMYRAALLEKPLLAGTVDLVRDASGNIAAAAIWYPPAGTRTPCLRQLPLTLRALGLYLRAFGIRGALRAARLQKIIQRHTPDKPHWYLKIIGTAPSARGQGLGSLLLAHRLRLIDAADQPAFLESLSPRSGTLYRRHGFVPVQRITEWANGQPWTMWRERRSLRPTQENP